jgi:hypothetical protein
VDKVVVPPTYPVALESHEKKDIKVERIILDEMKDHLIHHLFEKKMTKEMFDALEDGLKKETQICADV